MDGLKVSELAERSGLPATTVRFYDTEGLLPARRSRSGYRLFDDAAVERLRFIGTAKSLGLPLAEIRRLLEPWQHGQCAEVQEELAPLLERRIEETEHHVAELRDVSARLVRAREQLATIDRDGPCDPSCAFLGQRAQGGRPTLTALTALPRATPPPVSSVAPLIACTLVASERVVRVERWRAQLVGVLARESIDGGVRLRLDAARTRVGELAELAGAEAGCCSFLEITLHLGESLALEVRAPEHALVLVHELFGEPDS